MSADDRSPALSARGLVKSFQRDNGEIVRALDDVSIGAAHGTLTALVGPDGAGKTTLMRLIAGLMRADRGELRVLGLDAFEDPQQVQDRIGYMPQKFGLYEDLSVQENLDLYADLHGVSRDERAERYPRLMDMTGLARFTARIAGNLSGGMKQKLGLACALVRSPELLLLDEPTVGVDPLSRRELWEIILQLVHGQGLSVFLSTSYLDEAERCGHVIVLHGGRVLADGRPAEISRLAEGRTYMAAPAPGRKPRDLQARLLGDPALIDAVPEGGWVRLVMGEAGRDGRPAALSGAGDCKSVPARFEDGFMVLLRHRGAAGGAADRDDAVEKRAREAPAAEPEPDAPPTLERPSGAPGLSRFRRFIASVARPAAAPAARRDGAAVDVRDLVRRFGSFRAVDRVTFQVQRGEIYGLLGPNGAGKTTTFRMLCGLLPASEGELRVAAVDLRRARASARRRIGYVAQKFSLYGPLSVLENLEFFASAYGLLGERRRRRIDWALRNFDLRRFLDLPSEELPGGYKQRLAMAAALLHEPEILFLDEPTSGVDPLARREFWRRITALAAQGVTVIVTTHFMEEAEYCDRIAIMDAGRILAQGTPGELRRQIEVPGGQAPTMEDAFIAVVEKARDAQAPAESAA